jgi:cag pathogenicity island protein 24
MSMKYRRLTAEELSGLEKEFINFLIVNGIDAQQWEKIKSLDTGQAEKMIDIFSDMIFEGICSKVKYLEHFDTQGLKLFRCDDDLIRLTGIVPPQVFASVSEMLIHLSAHPDEYQTYHTSKAYMPDKNTEIFRMITAGAMITDGQYYEHFQNQ